MDQLKSILKEAIHKKVNCIYLRVKNHPELITSGISKPSGSDTRIAEKSLFTWYKFLFPQDQTRLADGKITRGVLKVPNVGKLLLIARPQKPASLYLYLPGNEQLFAAEWKRLRAAADAAKAKEQKAGAKDQGAKLPPLPVAAQEEPAVQDLATTAPAPEPPAQVASPPVVNQDREVAPEPPPPLPPTDEPIDEPQSGAPAFSLAQPVVANTEEDEPVNDGGFIPTFSESEKSVARFPANSFVNEGSDAPIQVEPADPVASTANAPGTPDIAAAAAISEAAEPPVAGEPVGPAEPAEPAEPAAPAMANIQVASQDSAPEQPRQALAIQQMAADAQVPVKNNIVFGRDVDSASSVSNGENPIDAILQEMTQAEASDVHFKVGEPICLRIHGSVVRTESDRLTPEIMEKLVLPITPQRNLDELASTNDTDFSYEFTGIGRFRCNLFRDNTGIGLVMRHIPDTILSMQNLGLPSAAIDFCSLPKGLVLVTGPTGSGKSTTLASMLDFINHNRNEHVITIEDPIEFVHPQRNCLFNQREVHTHTKSFSRALRAALREDPDIVLIGEMRDLETIHIALETAETGHLVFGTLHTTTAVSTIDRIIDQFPPEQQSQVRQMLAASLRGVITQQLLKKNGGGRVGAYEVLVVTDPVSAMIREGKTHMVYSHMQSQRGDGNVTYNDALIDLIKNGSIEPATAMRATLNRVDLEEKLKRAGIKIKAPARAS